MHAVPHELIKLPPPTTCSIIKRLNRFVVLVKCAGRERRAYITNTGRLKELLVRGATAYCIPKPVRRTDCRLIAVEEVKGPALIDTKLQEEAFAVAVNSSLIPWLKGFKIASRNPRISNSTFDYLLRNEDGKELIVELKSAVLRTGPHGEYASYPDCRSLRGERHLKDLTRLATTGKQVAVIFITTLHNVKAFTPHDKGDPKIRPLLHNLRKAGGLIKAIKIHYNPKRSEILLKNPDMDVIL